VSDTEHVLLLMPLSHADFRRAPLERIIRRLMFVLLHREKMEHSVLALGGSFLVLGVQRLNPPVQQICQRGFAFHVEPPVQ